MSPFDVHYQRSPIAGVVGEVTYHPAAFNHVMGSMFLRSLVGAEPLHEKSPHIYANERNVIRIDGDDLTAFVVQIADQQVNKIDCSVGLATQSPGEQDWNDLSREPVRSLRTWAQSRGLPRPPTGDQGARRINNTALTSPRRFVQVVARYSDTLIYGRGHPAELVAG